ncbi:hypothetical protein D3C81_2045870 [compost metagenome]
MAVGDHRARHRPPRIDVEIAGRAVQPFRAQHYQVIVGAVRVHALHCAAALVQEVRIRLNGSLHDDAAESGQPQARRPLR